MSNFLPGLYIVATPIGNLEDITLRALNVLKNSDQILCEDTRRSIKLLNHYGIKKKLVSYHKFNEKRVLNNIINYIESGKIVSIISDAGTPILSDPGLILVQTCIEKKIKIFPIPGPSSITAAMSASGFEDKYLFYGFLPKKNKEIEKILSKLMEYNFSIIFFVPAIKVNFYTKYFKKFFRDRKIFIAREMTKIHETFYWNTLDKYEGIKNKTKGEITVVISNKSAKNLQKFDLDKDKLKIEISRYLKRYTLKDVVKLISEKNGLPKKTVYQLCLSIKRND